ncbi:head maturation protease, ClpP-related [Castellaniella sp. S9]|uniref:head maturation protease, ClpP-related n=1 Tax=Castellaniella sp. S9 TaxID=2993652 RepID=UPI0022B4A56D|nr:head maturation protease, ClpP-related [Castellaniella sp. S9]
MKKKWYTIKALAANGQPAAEDGQDAARYEIDIFDEIGIWGISARDFIEDWRAIPDNVPILLSVNSPGGAVFDALAMYNVMSRASARITARVEGVAASAASLIIMAAHNIEIPANAYIMVHNPINFAFGDYNDLREVADVLENMHRNFASIYAARTGRPVEEIAAIMDAETWYNGTEAVAAGFADVELNAMAMAASLTEGATARFTRVPKALAAPAAPPTEPVSSVAVMPPDEIAALCADAGLAYLAAPLIRTPSSKETVTQRIAQAHEVIALASAAGREKDGEVFVRAGLSVDAVRARLLSDRADGATAINPHTPADARTPDDDEGARLNERLNYRHLYAARKAASKAN